MVKQHPLLVRQAAVQACLKRFDGRRLDWVKNDCVRLAALAMRKQGVAVPLLKGVRYSSPRTALRRIAELGHADLVEAMDATGLLRIAPAMALPGDIVAMPTDDEHWPAALAVSMNNGCILGFQNEVCQPLRPLDFVTAWRVS